MTKKIEIRGLDRNFKEVWRSARTARVAKAMLPLPKGYQPVRFDDGGVVLLVHADLIREAA